MLEIDNQQWSWNSIIPVITLIIGSLLTVFVNFRKEKSNRTTQIKIEKIKIYDEKKFQAYLELYAFISKAYSVYFPLDNPRQDFTQLMKKYFFARVKINYPYYKKGIREKMKILESQYGCLVEQDFVPEIPFEKFYRSDFVKILSELNQSVEKTFDEWGKK